LPSQLDDAQKEETHGQFGKGISGDGERVSHIGPEYGLGGVVEGECPKVLAETVVDGDLQAAGEDEEEDAGPSIQMVLGADELDDAYPGVESKAD
jgi:hypothetical protein